MGKYLLATGLEQHTDTKGVSQVQNHETTFCGHCCSAVVGIAYCISMPVPECSLVPVVLALFYFRNTRTVASNMETKRKLAFNWYSECSVAVQDKTETYSDNGIYVKVLLTTLFILKCKHHFRCKAPFRTPLHSDKRYENEQELIPFEIVNAV